MQADFFTMGVLFYEWLPAGTPPPPLLGWLGGRMCMHGNGSAACWHCNFWIFIWIVKKRVMSLGGIEKNKHWWLLHLASCRLRDPSCLSWRDSSFLNAMSQNQSSETTDLFSQDVVNQLFDMLDQWVDAHKQLCCVNAWKKTTLLSLKMFSFWCT